MCFVTLTGNQIHEAYVMLCSDVDARYFATQYTPILKNVLD